jgi:heme/copper-type cytochrome/quinol oxidase subunit 3
MLGCIFYFTTGLHGIHVLFGCFGWAIVFIIVSSSFSFSSYSCSTLYFTLWMYCYWLHSVLLFISYIFSFLFTYILILILDNFNIVCLPASSLISLGKIFLVDALILGWYSALLSSWFKSTWDYFTLLYYLIFYYFTCYSTLYGNSSLYTLHSSYCITLWYCSSWTFNFFIELSLALFICSYYWHFVDWIWLIVFLVFFI